jgi:hypothetical protein
MSTTSRVMACTPEDVFAVLDDGWSYPLWVVGAARIRDVDAGWPAVDTRIHHSVGTWPVLVDDTTSVVRREAPRLLRLRARAWPGGEAEVVIEVEAQGPERTLVTMSEEAVRGPARLVPKPIESALLDARNKESLRRLAYLAENREHAPRAKRAAAAVAS